MLHALGSDVNELQYKIEVFYQGYSNLKKTELNVLLNNLFFSLPYI